MSEQKKMVTHKLWGNLVRVGAINEFNNIVSPYVDLYGDGKMRMRMREGSDGWNGVMYHAIGWYGAYKGGKRTNGKVKL